MRPLIPPLRALASLLAVALTAILTTGCGCCDDDDDYYGGDLQVVNSSFSFEGIDQVSVSVPGGPLEFFDVFLAPGEDAFIALYPDDYDVDLRWSDGLFETFFDVPIYDEEVTTIVGEN